MTKKIIFLLAIVCMATTFSCKKKGCTDPKALNYNADAKKDDGSCSFTKVKIIEIKTPQGNMYMWLYNQTTKHRENFLKLADQGFYDNTTFHRIIQDFVIQGGDPLSKDSDPSNDGTGGPGYTIPAEFFDSLKHDYGAVGTARNNNPAKESNGSQFYIVVNKAGQHSLDKSYTVFGKIISGMPIADQISVQPKDAKDRPITNITMDVNVVEKTLDQLKTEFNFTP